ncbi:MAG TPA: sugar ABC transporter substrate-binding protein [Chloroflexota bacterium]|nr:sugar ABC transporter substrate-binding protein [Chloroflexota bacterium]
MEARRRPAISRRAFLLSGAALALTTACGPQEDLDSLPKQGESEGKIVYATWGNQFQRDAETWSLLAFEKNYPDLQIDVIWSATAGEHVQKQTSMLSAGAPPDVLRLPSWSAFTFYNEDAVRRLDGYFKRDGFKTEHLAPPFDVGTYNRRWYGLPRGTAGQWVFFYNRRLFSAAGVRAPANDWTWDDFLRTARELTRPAAGATPAQWGTALEPLADFYYPWLWGHGGEDIERTAEKSLIDQPAAREALQWLHDLRHKHKVAPMAGDIPDSLAAFASGRIATWFAPADAELELARMQPAVDFAIAPQPKGKQGQQAGYKPDVTCLSFNAQFPDDGWELIQFLVDADTQKLEYDNGLWLPQSKSLVGSESYQKPATAPYDRRPGIPNATVKARVPVMLPRGDEMRSVAQRELAAFWRGTRTVQDATDAAAKAVNAILNGEA